MTTSETPQQLLERHPLTAQLRDLGMTPEQLDAVRFSTKNQGCPFDLWSITFAEGTPRDAIGLLKSYCTLKWLILEKPPSSRDTEDAWRQVSDTTFAPIYAIGLRAKEAQSKRARRPRGKVTDDGKTIHELIAALLSKREHQDMSAKELWLPFYAELEEHGLVPEEKHDPADPTRPIYEYEFNGRRKHMSYGQFANTVSKIRRKKSA
jgi:hypothetical protein